MSGDSDLEILALIVKCLVLKVRTIITCVCTNIVIKLLLVRKSNTFYFIAANLISPCFFVQLSGQQLQSNKLKDTKAIIGATDTRLLNLNFLLLIHILLNLY